MYPHFFWQKTQKVQTKWFFEDTSLLSLLMISSQKWQSPPAAALPEVSAAVTTSDVRAHLATRIRSEHSSRSFVPGTGRDPLDFWRAHGRLCNKTLENSQCQRNWTYHAEKSSIYFFARALALTTFSDAFKRADACSFCRTWLWPRYKTFCRAWCHKSL